MCVVCSRKRVSFVREYTASFAFFLCFAHCLLTHDNDCVNHAFVKQTIVNLLVIICVNYRVCCNFGAVRLGHPVEYDTQPSTTQQQTHRTNEHASRWCRRRRRRAPHAHSIAFAYARWMAKASHTDKRARMTLTQHTHTHTRTRTASPMLQSCQQQQPVSQPASQPARARPRRTEVSQLCD